MKNLELWNALEKTDPAYTKNFNRGGFQGTAINPTYVAKRLTEKFGPCGVGWRLDIHEERYALGHPIQDFSQQSQPVIGHHVVHVVRGVLEYYLDGDWRTTGPQYGQTTFVGTNKNGMFTDEEAPKKSITDCLSKCAALLGVSADIYLGSFDGNKYVNDPTAESVSPAASVQAARSRVSGNQTANAPRVSASPAAAQTPADASSAPEKPKRGRKPKAGAVDPKTPPGKFTYHDLPTGFVYFLPEQWSDFYDSISDPALLATAVGEMVKLTELAEDKNTFEGLCKQVSNVAKKLSKPGEPEWKSICESLHAAKQLIAA